MNLITNYLENSFEIKNKTINTLVIEDPKFFANFINQLILTKNKISKEFEIIEDYKEIDISKVTDIIFDLFNLEINNASMLKKLYVELEEDLNSEEMYQKKIELESHVLNLTDEIIYRSRFSITAKEINYLNFFKTIGIEFDYEKNNLLERLIEYIKISFELSGTRLFIIINLDSFLSTDELIEFNNFLCYNEIKVLALQNSLNRIVLESENLRIIDKDLCEI